LGSGKEHNIATLETLTVLDDGCNHWRAKAQADTNNMKSNRPSRMRDSVYVIGAGFSQGLGYPAVISFNWDLILDHQLFKGDLNSQKYGLTDSLGHGPVLLKPHGSLNWYRGTQLDRVPGIKRIEIFPSKDASRRVHAFLRPRGVKSKSGKRYTPLIIPPTYFKEFRPSIFKRLWQNCTDVLSTPKRLVFLGYSLPPADLHAQFILRCGFHNQLNGRIKDSTSRYPATGPAEVTIVNPDQQAARRIEAVAGPQIPCTWVPERVEDWIGEDR
jgi:hypothetical protein